MLADNSESPAPPPDTGELERQLCMSQTAFQKLQEELYAEKARSEQLEHELASVKASRPADAYLHQILDVAEDGEEPDAKGRGEGQPSRLLMNVDEMLDIFVTVYDECKHLNRGRRSSTRNIEHFINRYEAPYRQAKTKRMNISHFEAKAIIGRGSFSTVKLVKHKESGKPYVIKRMGKATVCERHQSVDPRTELEFLIQASSSPLYGGHPAPGITALHYAFHDPENLYLVLQYYPGGDLLSLLGKHEFFKEDMARFYFAEMVVAVNTVHHMGYLHRDIKIENFLLDARGHIYLTDFGSAVRLGSDGKARGYLSGGTSEYLAPEMIAMMQGDKSVAYGPGVDWWSLGIVLYEMLTGETPFYDESILQVYHKIANHQASLSYERFEPYITVSPVARDLISQLLTDQESRLGRNGVAEIMNHEFFAGVDWDLVRRGYKVPFKPNLVGQFDTTFFDYEENDEDEDSTSSLGSFSRQKSMLLRRSGSTSYQTDDPQFGSLLPFVGFTFVRQTALDGDVLEGTPFIEEKVRSHYKQKKKQEKPSLTGSVDQLCPPVPSVPTGEVICDASGTAELSVGEQVAPDTDTLGPLSQVPRGVAAIARVVSIIRPASSKPNFRRVRFGPDVMFLDAARSGDLEQLKELADAEDIDINTQKAHGATALHEAATEGHADVVQYLVSLGADMELRDSDDYTVLMRALVEEEWDCAKVLLKAGADVTKTAGDQSVVDLATDPAVKASVLSLLEQQSAQQPESVSVSP